MTSFHKNNYVIQIEDLREGKSYKVISTVEHYQTAILKIRRALEKPEALLRQEYLQTSYTQEDREALARAGISPPLSTPLWDGWATIAYGKTDRVQLSFEIAPDLALYHRFTGRYTYSGLTAPISAQAGSDIVPPEAREYVLVIKHYRDWQLHCIVSTHQHMKRLTDALTEALKHSTSNQMDDGERTEPTLLWRANAWALIWGNTPRSISLSFELATEVERYHDYKEFQRRDIRRRWLNFAGVLIGLAAVSFVIVPFIVGVLAIAGLVRIGLTIRQRLRPKDN